MVCPITQGDHNYILDWIFPAVLKNMNAISSACTWHDVLGVKADESLAPVRPVRDPKHHAKALILHCSLRTRGTRGRMLTMAIIFLPCSFFSILYLLLLFSSPNLSGHRLDVYHISTHGVALVRIYSAGLKCAACGSLQMQDPKKSPKVAIWAPSHNFVGLYLCN